MERVCEIMVYRFFHRNLSMRFFIFLACALILFGCTTQSVKDDTENVVTPPAPKLIPPPLEKPVNQTPASVCSDTEADENLFVKGIVTIGGKAFSDRCVDAHSVEKYACNDSVVRVTTYVCPDSYECTDGACISVIPPSCIDSDNGTDIYLKGTVIRGSDSYVDSCRDPSSVNEYYCDTNTIKNIIKNCPLGNSCTDGACALSPTTCIDTDYGISEHIPGNVTVYESTGNSILYEDKCENKDFLVEYYCSNDSVTSERIGCIRSRKEECLRGACQKPRTCEDTDRGNDSLVKGTVTIVDKSDLEPKTSVYEDVCLTLYTLKEYSCSEDDYLVIQEISCDGNCDNGRC